MSEVQVFLDSLGMLPSSPATEPQMLSVQESAYNGQMGIGTGARSSRRRWLGLLNAPNVKNYADLMTFVFAVDEINKETRLLPNVTLGYHLADTCGDLINSIQNVFNILSGDRWEVPNYSCSKREKVIGFVGDSVPMAQLLGMYGYSKIRYDMPGALPKNNHLYRTFFTTNPYENIRYTTISNIARSFGWNWVGILTPFDESGEEAARALSKELDSHGVCVAYIIKLSRGKSSNLQKLNTIKKSKARIVIICGKFFLHYDFLKDSDLVRENITFILEESWSYGFHLGDQFLQAINCSLVFSPPIFIIPGLETFLHSLNIDNRPDDPILEDIWYFYFACLIPNKEKLFTFQILYEVDLSNCTGRTHHITSQIVVKSPSFYFIYTAVYILAYSVREMIVSVKGNWDDSRMNRFREKLHRFIRRVHYIDHTGHHVRFNKDRELFFPMYFYNWIFSNKEPGHGFLSQMFGYIEHSDTQGEYTPYVHDGKITWKTSSVPQSRCSEMCSPGYRKAHSTYFHVCCYNCVLCSAGEISNVTDSKDCYRCPDDEWPDEKREECIPKAVEFLSYTADVLTSVVSSISLLFSTITLNILRLFVFFWDTPLVKANNRTVSFILLVSILLSFLSVFFFLGRPVDITCLLRQTLFGFFFSVSLSSVLAKTIMVCIVFRATKPGSIWKKWMEAKCALYIVVTCSSVQILICLTWLLVSPPYVEFDHQSYPGKIIIQCNEGSDIWFYSMLGYLGSLAAVSFVLAFMVRTLPDTFNEAKYITFSMLVFCSVWIAMIPAYLSTRGKYMVTVEIFAILTSLVVIFDLAVMVRTLPDSYIEAKYITFSMLVFCSVWIAMIPAYLSTRGK
ncbi:vomeronasal type-2 receptor 26-like [Dendropsophus ebraccatus]|uniref:vomeronasal type-2 receptor 26-like n=1 Tax=Dendropsophus ebraccatus TaxID=150705 RepID=UPI0038313A93